MCDHLCEVLQTHAAHALRWFDFEVALNENIKCGWPLFQIIQKQPLHLHQVLKACPGLNTFNTLTCCWWLWTTATACHSNISEETYWERANGILQWACHTIEVRSHKSVWIWTGIRIGRYQRNFREIGSTLYTYGLWIRVGWKACSWKISWDCYMYHHVSTCAVLLIQKVQQV